MQIQNSIFDIRETLSGMTWPAIPSPRTAALLSLHVQLEQFQWLPSEEILAHQFRQLQSLLQHAWSTVPHYRKSLESCGYHPESLIQDLDVWERIPVLSRKQLQSLGEDIRSNTLPEGHGPGQPVRSSGSTGMPVTIYRNNIDRQFWHAITLRDHVWHGRDITAKLAIIRKLDNREAPPPNGRRLDTWGLPFSQVYKTGPAAVLDLGDASVRLQAEWLKVFEPDYLLTYPTNVAALAQYSVDNGLALTGLREVMTLSESISHETREVCRGAWGVEIKDMYSAQEVGYIALQCPEAEHYHVQSESLLVEVLDEQGKQCSPGEVGRVVVTNLHGFASPLLRYDVGDYAEVGEACPCGRGLPVLKRIMGRSRNMLTFPSGDQVWPVVRPSYYSKIAPVCQVQMVQLTREKIEVRLVASAQLTAEQESSLSAAIRESLGYQFQLDLKYLDEIPRTPGGKFEEFISLVD